MPYYLSYQQLNNEKFKLLMDFLRKNPQFYSGKTSLDDTDFLFQKFSSPRHSQIELRSPSTTPDQAVSVILGAAYDYTSEQLDYIKEVHLQSMAAENKVGELLEMYLANKLEPLGWVWCSGNFVKAVDFLKYENGNWRLLQIKNRDNTENSSSSQIRNGTNIEKWFRTFSKPSSRRASNTNWENFPENISLNEEEFLAFVCSQLSNRY